MNTPCIMMHYAEFSLLSVGVQGGDKQLTWLGTNCLE